MEPDKKPEDGKPATATPAGAEANPPAANSLATPSDASSTNDSPNPDSMAPPTDTGSGDSKPPKKVNPLKKFLKRFNVYLLLFALLLVIGLVVITVSYLDSKKAPKAPSVASQSLTQSELKQLANSNATVGGSGQTLTVQGNAVFSGQVLVRGSLDVAGTIQLGSQLVLPQLTVSGTTNLSSTQISSLQVANNTTFQGLVTIQNGENIAGPASFSGSVSIGSLTVTNLIMSGNAQLQVPNHVAFTGATPGRTIDFGVLGNGGSASIFGSDTSGTININTGNNPVAGCFISLVFNKPFTSTPHVLVSPVGIGAGETEYYVNRSNTSFSVCTVNAAPANQAFAFDYFITD